MEVHYSGTTAWWNMFVDETTALELCRRRDITSMEEASEFLMRRGTRFRFAYQPDPRDRAGISLVPRPHVYLGWRAKGFNPDKWDYKAYESSARDLLREPRGRAAVLRGGIVWRIAVELLGEDAIRDAIQGPSADVWKLGREISVGRGDPWYEDMLSESELDVISGVYKVYTGKPLNTSVG